MSVNESGDNRLRPPLDEPTPLRKPKENFVKTHKERATSHLNVSAPEFVPTQMKYSIPQDGSSQPENTPYETVHNAHSGSFYIDPYADNNDIHSYYEFQRLSLDRPEHLRVSEEADMSLVDQFKEVLFVITTRPSLIDDTVYISDYLWNFATNIDSPTTLTEIIHIIIEQGITEQNFRYSGARICSMLIKMIVEFRSLLIELCRKEFSEFFKESVNLKRRTGFLMFLAELFVYLKLIDGSPYGIFLTVILQGINQLLTPSSNSECIHCKNLNHSKCQHIGYTNHIDVDCIKCICQVLKLTRSTIYEYSHFDPDTLNLIPVILEKIAPYKNFHPTLHGLVTSVVEQYGDKQNVHISQSPQPPIESQSPVIDLNEPVFYGSDNGIITRQQAGFVDEEETDLYRGGEIWMQMQDLNLASGMDPEMEEAYEKFLREQRHL